MNAPLSQTKKGLLLDPRTKLLMLITVTTLMFSTSNNGIMNLVKPVLSIIPFALLLSERKLKDAEKTCFYMRHALHWNAWLSLNYRVMPLF